MNTVSISVRNLRKILAILAIFALVFGPFAKIDFADAVTINSPYGDSPISNVSLCHSDGQSGNYSYLTVSISAAGDPNGHTGQAHSNDIIPPYYYTDAASTTQFYAGQNWTTDNQTFWTNSCAAVVAPTTGTLIINKSTSGVSSSTWSFAFTGDHSLGHFNLTNSNPASTFSDIATGTYSITEDHTSGTNWSQTSATCDNNNDPSAVTIGAGDTVTCTFVNTITPAATTTSTTTPTKTITIEKTVSGGIATTSDFTFRIDNTVVSAGVQNVVATGTHTLSEDSYPNYTAGNWGGDCAANGSVTVDSSKDNYTCTLTNTYAPAPAICSITEVSDDTNTVTEKGGAFATSTYVHPNWTASIPGATWIWGTYLVEDPSIQTTETFVKTFDWNGPITDATLVIASDNGYSVTVNGHNIASTTASNYLLADQDTITVPAADIVSGANTLQIAVTNDAYNTTDPHVNPAGLLYKLSVSGTDSNCGTLPAPSSIRIIKDFSSDAPSTWSFDFTGTLGDFTLTNSTTTETFDNLSAGTYDVTESVPNDWEAPSVSCINGDETNAATSSITNGTSITLPAGDDVTCVFVNTAKQDGNGNGNGTTTPAQCIGANLLQNASFETPVASANSYNGGFWEYFSSIPNWASNAGFEVWNTMFGGASDGAQNLELAANSPTTITQDVPTVAGNTYKLTYDFAPRPQTAEALNSMDVIVNGVVATTTSADGINDTTNNWKAHYYEFTASSSTTTISFKDNAASGSEGVLLDNTAVCLTQDNSVPTVPKYHIYGYVWNDKNQNDVWETEPENPSDKENPLDGWTVTITDGSTTLSTTTDSTGLYYFDVPAGDWTITETVKNQWGETFPNDNGGSYPVTVPSVVSEAQHQSVFASLLSAVIPTAYAAAVNLTYGPYNFGNYQIPSTTNTSSSHRTGSYISLSSGNGSVLGASTTTQPVGQVLGASTSTIPVGAPNTGAGGTSPLVTYLPSFSAILSQRSGARKAQNG